MRTLVLVLYVLLLIQPVIMLVSLVTVLYIVGMVWVIADRRPINLVLTPRKMGDIEEGEWVWECHH